MAKKLELRETLLKSGYGEKEIALITETLETLKKESEEEFAAYKKTLEESNDKLIQQEAKKVAEAAIKNAHEKYLTDLENAKKEIRKECDDAALKALEDKSKSIKETFEAETQRYMEEKAKEIEEKALKEAYAKAEAQLAEAMKVVDEKFEHELKEALSIYKGELKLDAEEKLDEFEASTVELIDAVIRDATQEGLSESEIKNYAVDKINAGVLAEVMKVLETKFVAPDTEGHRLLQEKDEEIVQLRECLAKEHETSETLRRNNEKLAKKTLLEDNMKGLPDAVRTNIEKLTENEKFDTALQTVRAVNEAYRIMSEGQEPAVPAEPAPRLTNEQEKLIERAAKITEMFTSVDEAVGLVNENSDVIDATIEPAKKVDEGYVTADSFKSSYLASLQAKYMK